MIFEYQPVGVCSRKIILDIDDSNTINSLQVIGGCNGNLKGISSIVKGMNIDRVIEAFEGTECGYKKTSCPDQIAKALIAYKNSLNS